MDTTQLLLTIILILTTFLLIIVGVQLFFVLKELRVAIKKVNHIIDGFEALGTDLDNGLSEIVGFFNGFRTVLKAMEIIKLKKNEKNK